MKTKKNLLDLRYHKYLQFYTTMIIIAFTYFVGVGVALLTKQRDLLDNTQLITFSIASLALTGGALTLLSKFQNQMKKTSSEIENLIEDLDD